MRTMQVILRKAGTAVAVISVAAMALLGSAQTRANAEPVETLRNNANAGTIGVVSGGVDGTYVRIAAAWLRCSTTATIFGSCRSSAKVRFAI